MIFYCLTRDTEDSYTVLQMPSTTDSRILEMAIVGPGFLPGIFFRRGAKSIVMQISFVMLLFSDQFQGGTKVFGGGGGQSASGAPPVEESQGQPFNL